MKLIINTDGSSIGNPGPSGVGYVIREPSGDTLLLLEEHSEPIGCATNDYAEYRAVIRGLERAVELGADEVELRCDSLIVVRQIDGTCAAKDPALRDLCRRARALMGKIQRCEITHVYSTNNLDADFLAKKASAREKGRRR